MTHYNVSKSGSVPSVLGVLMHDFLDPSAQSRSDIPVDLIMLTVVVLLTAVFRVWAERAENSNPEGQERHRITLRRALLFYRFHERAANVVRSIFYCWILFLVIPTVGVMFGAELCYVPGRVLYLFTFAAYAVALRFWAVSLDERRTHTRRHHGVSSSPDIAGVLPAHAHQPAYVPSSKTTRPMASGLAVFWDRSAKEDDVDTRLGPIVPG